MRVSKCGGNATGNEGKVELRFVRPEGLGEEKPQSSVKIEAFGDLKIKPVAVPSRGAERSEMNGSVAVSLPQATIASKASVERNVRVDPTDSREVGPERDPQG
jgi:hypothetical protein